MAMIIKQAIMWGLTVHRKRVAERDGWSHAIILKQVIRDGAGMMVAATGMQLFLSYELLTLKYVCWDFQSMKRS